MLYVRIDNSDIKICMLPLDSGASIDPMIEQMIDDDTYVILNKEDTISHQELSDISKKIKKKVNAKKVWTVSCETGLGMDQFLAELIDILKSRYIKANVYIAL